MVTINIKNRNLYFISTVIILLIGMGVVVAWTLPGQTADPSVMGHSADEIDSESLNEIIDMRINLALDSGIGQVTCSVTPIYESMTGGASFKHVLYKYTEKDIPSQCIDITSIGCVIKMEIWNNAGIKQTKFCNYFQSASGSWSCSNLQGVVGQNGDKTAKRIVGIDSLAVRDDYYNTCSGCTKENNALKWIFTDLRSDFGMKVYICIEDSPSE